MQSSAELHDLHLQSAYCLILDAVYEVKTGYRLKINDTSNWINREVTSQTTKKLRMKQGQEKKTSAKCWTTFSLFCYTDNIAYSHSGSVNSN